MGFIDSLKKVIGIEEIDDDMEITEEEVKEAREKINRDNGRRAYGATVPGAEASKPAQQSSFEKRVSIANSTNPFKMVVIEPKAFEECPKLVDSLKGRRPVIINLEKLETEVARKIFDFLSGATYALNGNVQKVANNIFIFAPENVNIAAGQESKAGFDFSNSKNPWR